MGYHHELRWEARSLRSAWPLNGNKVHEQQHGFRVELRPQTSAGPLVVAWGHGYQCRHHFSKTMEPEMALEVRVSITTIKHHDPPCVRKGLLDYHCSPLNKVKIGTQTGQESEGKR